MDSSKCPRVLKRRTSHLVNVFSYFVLPISNIINSIHFSKFATRSEPLNYCLALRASVRQDGREGGPAVRVLHTSLLGPGQWDWQRTS